MLRRVYSHRAALARQPLHMLVLHADTCWLWLMRASQMNIIIGCIAVVVLVVILNSLGVF